ncbi:MAG: hypothetical protein K2X86_13155 [Cytophagaceae bacterium]|nr:hypothetical protein [Cytophagaceae bacterium]
MNHHQNNNGTIFGTIGGTLLSIFANVDAGDIVKTAILAAVGAVASFGVSLLLKKIVQLIK